MQYAVIPLRGIYRETERQVKSLSSAAADNAFRFDLFLSRIEHLLRRRRVRDVLIDCKPSFRVPLFAGLDAIGRQLSRLRDAGKTVHFCADTLSDSRLFLASYCDRRCIHPSGSVQFLGLSRSFIFLKRLLNRYRVDVHVVRRGEFKSGADTFRRDTLDPRNAEQYRRYLELAEREIVDRITHGIGRSEEDIANLKNGAVLNAQQAVEAGWAHEVRSSQQLLHEWEQAKHKKYELKQQRPGFGRGRRKVAVLVLEGMIRDEKSQYSPLLGQSIGGDSFAEEIRALRKNRQVKGVVFRVSSPGGTVVGSETIVKELMWLAEKKPLVVSMGEVAGSGGYWISSQAERIFVHPGTITGSIGALLVLFQARDLLNRFGLTTDSVTTGPYADFPSPYRKLSDTEREILEGRMDDLYRMFLERVSNGRGMSLDRVDELAQGRIWAGSDAVRNGLADDVGGISEAVEYLKEKLGIRSVEVSYRPRIKYSRLERLIFKRQKVAARAGRGRWTESAESTGAAVGNARQAVQNGAAAGIPGLSADLELLQELHGEPLALAPELLTLHDPRRRP